MTILLPTNATASGECDENQNEPYIILGWNSKEGSYNFTMYFHKFGKERWSAANLTFSLKTAVGSNGLLTFLVHSFSCFNKLVNVNFTQPTLKYPCQKHCSPQLMAMFLIPISIHTVHSLKSSNIINCYSSVIIFINEIH